MKYILSISVVIILLSCSQLTIDQKSISLNQPIDSELLYIPNGDFTLKSNDAMTVARNWHHNSKSSSTEIKNVIPINNEAGDVVMYAVNFSDGYCIVSATKHYYPVIMDIPHGFFCSDSIKDNIKIILDEYISCVSHSVSNDSLLIAFKPAWIKYENNRVSSPATKSSDSYSSYISVR